jgi:hypothetical protein
MTTFLTPSKVGIAETMKNLTRCGAGSVTSGFAATVLEAVIVFQLFLPLGSFIVGLAATAGAEYEGGDQNDCRDFFHIPR